MTILVTTIALSLGLVTPVYAGTEIVTREVTGYGETEKLAVIDALIEGISQVLGISVAAKDELRSEFTEVIKEEGGQSESSLLATTEMKEEISTQSKGYVKTYEILSVVFLPDDGHFKAVLSVQIPKYVAADQGRSKMRTIAVLPFRDLSTGQKESSSLSLSRQLNQNLISELTQARKFRVLDREYLAELTGEQNVLKSDDVAMEETLRLGQNLGADYLVVGTITDYRIDQKSKEVLGLTTVQHEAALVFDYRVIALATREVMWSGTYNEFFNHRRLRKLVPKNSDDRQVRDAMIAHAAHGVASELLDAIFPIKVLSMNADNEVYLNQGGIRVKEGEIFEIFSPGQKVVDPDTGLAMRLDGARVATIEIISVRAKFSVGRLVDGDPDQIYQHAISRRAAAAVVEAMKTETKAKKKKVEW
jgi:TolB-like protein